MQLSHKIALRPTQEQAAYFQQAAGTARFTWNWALAEWNRQYEAGLKPSAMALKKQFNAIKYTEFPWLEAMHRDSHAQPFANLSNAWSRFFADIKAKRKAFEPVFKRKGRSRDSFYVANDKFRIQDNVIRLPKVGYVAMTECLRFQGKILGATVSRRADRWYVAIQIEVSDQQALLSRTGNGTVGVDLGVKAAATLSTGESYAAPKPLKGSLRRLQIRSRAVSRKLESSKTETGLGRRQPLPKGARLRVSQNRNKSSLKLAKLHLRIANLRADFTHKLTTRLCRENQAVVLEDLNVKGMLANERLARAISDVGFGMIRQQMEYKSKRYGTRLVLADRWYPSSRLCSICGWKNESLALKDREWTCLKCGFVHDRDHNAAVNLERLATETALPVASSAGNGGTATEKVSAVGGKVTPVSYEVSLQGTSGQEETDAHICAPSQ